MPYILLLNHYIDYYQDYNNEKMVSKIQILIPSASNYSIILNTNELIHEKKDIPIQVPSASKVEFSEMMDVYYNEQWHHVSVQMAPQFVMIYKANQQVSSRSFPFFPHILESSTLLLGIPLKKAQISLLNASNFSTLVFKISLYFQFNRWFILLISISSLIVRTNRLRNSLWKQSKNSRRVLCPVNNLLLYLPNIVFLSIYNLYIELILPYQSTNNSHIDLSLSSFYNEPNRLFVFNEVKNASFIKITIDHEDILFDFPSSLKGQQCYDLLRKLKKKQTNPSKEQRNYECIFIDLFLIE